MSGGSKTQTTTQNTKSDPWAPAQPGLQKILSAAQSAFEANPIGRVYGGDRTAGLGADTQSGLDTMRAGATIGTGTALAGTGFANGLLANGGATAATQGAGQRLANIDTNVGTAGVARAANRLSDPNSVARIVGTGLASGAFATDATPLGSMASGLAGGGTQTQRSLQDAADGKFLSGANPYLESIIAREQDRAASSVGQRFAASGRYGSGRFAAATADAVSGIGTNLRYQDYEAERTRQAQAAAAIDAAGNANASTVNSLYQGLAGINQGNAGLATTGANLSLASDQAGLAGQTTLAGLQAGNVDRSMSQANTLLAAAQGDRQAGLAGIAALPTIQNALTNEGRVGAQVGAIRDAAHQDDINADMARFSDEQAAPWEPAGRYLGIAAPIAGLGGTTSGTTIQKIPQPSIFQQIMGLALAGADTASKFYGK